MRGVHGQQAVVAPQAPVVQRGGVEEGDFVVAVVFVVWFWVVV